MNNIHEDAQFQAVPVRQVEVYEFRVRSWVIVCVFFNLAALGGSLAVLSKSMEILTQAAKMQEVTASVETRQIDNIDGLTAYIYETREFRIWWDKINFCVKYECDENLNPVKN